MGKRGRGRPQAEGLRWHKGKGRHYRMYGGKFKYFGPKGDRSDVEDAARAAWIAFENAQVNAVATDTHCRMLELDVDWDHKMQEQMAALNRHTGRMEHSLEIVESAKQAIHDNPEQAEAIRQDLGDLLPELLPQDDPQPAQPTGPTCQDVVDAYLAYLNSEKNPTSYLDAKKSLKHWLAFIDPARPVASLTRDDLLGYRENLSAIVKAGLSQETANKRIQNIKTAFTRAEKDRGIMAPLRMLKILERKSTPPKRKVIFDRADVDLMMKKLPFRWQTMLTLGLNMAARNEDLALAKWEMIHTNEQGKHYIDFPRHKTGRERRIFMWPRTMKILELWKAKSKRKSGLIFPNSNGKPLIQVYFRDGKPTSTGDYVSRFFTNELKRLDLKRKGYSAKTICKSAATIAHRGGVDATTVLMLLGDAPGKVWEAYIGTFPEQIAKAVRIIEKHYFGAK